MLADFYFKCTGKKAKVRWDYDKGEPVGDFLAFVQKAYEQAFKGDAIRPPKADFPERGQMLAPWLPEGLAMIFAPRGVGKTWIGLGASHIVAGGGQFLKWKAPRARGFWLSALPAAQFFSFIMPAKAVNSAERPGRRTFWTA